MPNQLPFDLQSSQNSLDRRRKMAEMMTARLGQQQQGQMVSGHYVAPNALQNILGPALSMFAAEKMGKGFDAEQAGIAGQRNEQLSSGLKNYFDTRQGKPGEVLGDVQAQNLMTNDQAPALAEPTAADPRRAAIEALTSQLPELQALGKSDISGMGKEQMSAKDILGLSGFDPKSRLAAALSGGNLSQLTPQAEYMSVDGRVVDKNNPTQVAADYRESFGAPFERGGDWYQKDSRGKEIKLDNAPKTTVTVDNRQGVQKGVGEYYKATGESIAPGGKSNVSAAGAQEALNSSVEALQAINNGARQGIAQPAMQVLRKLGAELGMQNSETAPTDALTAAVKSSVFKDLGGLGAQVSDGDRKFVAEFTGDLATDPMAMKRMMALRIAAQIKKINTHNKVVSSFATKADDPTIEGEAGLPLSITIPDEEVSNMVQNVLTGKPTTQGMPQYQVPGKGKSAAAKPTVSNW
jgi:hypothetical protein